MPNPNTPDRPATAEGPQRVTLYQCDGVRDDGMSCGTKDAELCGTVERKRRRCVTIGTYVRIDSASVDIIEEAEALRDVSQAIESRDAGMAAHVWQCSDLLLAESARANAAEAGLARFRDQVARLTEERDYAIAERDFARAAMKEGDK
jgi:hypothetical protein